MNEYRELLGTMLGHKGPRFFWSTLDYVVSVALGEFTNRQPPSPDLTVFGNVSFASVAQLLPRGDGASIGNPEEASRYFAEGTDVKKNTYNKDPARRLERYREVP